MEYIRGIDRHQLSIQSLDQLVDAEAFVRLIDAFVDIIDMASFGFKYAARQKEGRPPFDPAQMMKLYLYGYKNGIRSCRKLQKATKVNIEVMWLLHGLSPHYKTIENFRKENAAAFRSVFRQFVYTLKEWDLVDGKNVAIDSVKIRAQNSLKNNYNKKKVNRHLDYIENKLAEYEAQLDEDLEEGEREDIEKKVEYTIEKWNEYCEIGQQLLDEEIDQISTTDTDARAVILHRNIIHVGYNIQAASDGKHKLLIGMDTGSVNDTSALSSMVEIVQQNIQKKKMKVLADKGYHTGYELAKCDEMGVETYVSPKANAANKRFSVYPSEDFKYHAASDTYRCPNDKIMRTNGTIYKRKMRANSKQSISFKHYKTTACKSCLLKHACTSSKSGRVIQRTEYQWAIEKNNNRVNKTPTYYRQRQQIIEHQFGTFKRQWGFTHTLMRGKEKVLGEVSILFTTYNLRRTMSVMGFSALLGRLKALKVQIFNYFVLRSIITLHMIL